MDSGTAGDEGSCRFHRGPPGVVSPGGLSHKNNRPVSAPARRTLATAQQRHHSARRPSEATRIGQSRKSHDLGDGYAPFIVRPIGGRENHRFALVVSDLDGIAACALLWHMVEPYLGFILATMTRPPSVLCGGSPSVRSQSRSTAKAIAALASSRPAPVAIGSTVRAIAPAGRLSRAPARGTVHEPAARPGMLSGCFHRAPACIGKANGSPGTVTSAECVARG